MKINDMNNWYQQEHITMNRNEWRYEIYVDYVANILLIDF